MTTRLADVAIIGGGPAGYSAALAAARRGASVVLAESERLGGNCVQWSCVPTNIMLSVAHSLIDLRELSFHGIIEVPDQLDLHRLTARREGLVRMLTGSVSAALAQASVTVLPGRAALRAHGLTVGTEDDHIDVEATSVILAAGARWTTPEIDGIPADRVLTADLVQGLTEVPASALVLGGGPAATGFALEYATLLATLGSDVTLAIPGEMVLPGLDAELDPSLEEALAAAGIRILRAARVLGGDASTAVVDHGAGETTVGAEVVIVADRRIPAIDGYGLAELGIDVAAGAVAVDESCRTSRDGVFAAGDLTGGSMLSAAALHMGAVAGEVAAGGTARVSTRAVPHVLHTMPECGWIGLAEADARARGLNAIAAIVDLATNARALSLGGRDGLLKLVADAETGEILGIHVIGPGVEEIIAAATVAMHAELTVDDLAALTPWHPSLVESLIGAARLIR